MAMQHASGSVRNRLRFSRLLPIALAALTTTTCTPASPDDFYDVVPAIWIQARWAGGAAGPPSNSSSDVPSKTAAAAPYCPPSSIILENHGTRFLYLESSARNELIIYNNCNAALELAVCVTAGSGGGGSFLPICSQAPRLTPLSNLNFYSLDSRQHRPETTPANLDINIFYCPGDLIFAAGVIPGANASDCVKF
jgi:hypothetical protein